MRLNLGCGDDILEGYINIDVIKKHPSVVIGDVTNLPVPASACSEIYAKDIYEHISHLHSVDLLKHWHDKLAPGGRICIITTSLIDIISKINSAMKKSNHHLVSKYIVSIFGGQSYPSNFHYNIGYEPSLRYDLINVGFLEQSIKFSYSIDVHPSSPNIENQTNMKIEAVKSFSN